MKTKAILMTIAMMSAALAGCTGSDGVAEIDDATLQELFDDNIQDFMNNTSVTVHQEIHYHNNTTVNNYETTNEYSNTTNVDGERSSTTTRTTTHRLGRELGMDPSMGRYYTGLTSSSRSHNSGANPRSSREIGTTHTRPTGPTMTI